MPANANWPTVTVNADFTQGPPSTTLSGSKQSINSGTVAVTSFNSKRGRQYELDTVRAGTASLTISDPTEQLNPLNGSSIYNSSGKLLLPYRQIQIQATWAATTYNVFTGFIERYPQAWVDGGTRGVRTLDAVDAMGIASRTVITPTYVTEVAADAPIVLIPFTDTHQPINIVTTGPQGIDYYLNPGTNGSVIAYGQDETPFGTPGLTIGQTRQDNSSILAVPLVTNIDTRTKDTLNHFQLDTRGFTLEFWAKFDGGPAEIMLRSNASAANLFPIPASETYLGVRARDNPGDMVFEWNDSTTGNNLQVEADNLQVNPLTAFPDGQWHHYVMRFFPDGTNPTTQYDINVWRDGAGFTWTTAGWAHRIISINSILVQSRVFDRGTASSVSIAYLAVYNSKLSDTRVLAHYKAGKGNVGELSNARASRLFSLYWSGGSSASIGTTPVPMSGDDYSGRSLLDVLQEVAKAEEGLVYASAGGTLNYTGRSVRDNAAVSAVFGENTAAGEIPYVDLSYDYDPSYVYSDTNITRPDGSTAVTATNAATRAVVGQRTIQQELKVTDDFYLQQASTFYLKRYSGATPTVRIDTLELHPHENTALWPVVLATAIGQRYTVKRRTSAGVVMSADFFCESIEHDVDGDAGTWICRLQLSPVFVPQTWVLADATKGVLGTTTIPGY